MIVALPLATSLAAGLALQRHPARDRLLRLLWTVSFCVLGPLTSLYAFAALPLDRRTALLAALVACTMWSALAVDYLYGLVAGRDARERATLALPIAFWNTGYVGYVVAQILWGQHGFALMVFFDQVGFLIPAVVISTAIAGTHGRGGRDGGGFVRRLVLNPPLAGAASPHSPSAMPLGRSCSSAGARSSASPSRRSSSSPP